VKFNRSFPFPKSQQARVDRRCAEVRSPVKKGKMETPNEPLSLSLKAPAVHSAPFFLTATVTEQFRSDR